MTLFNESLISVLSQFATLKMLTNQGEMAETSNHTLTDIIIIPWHKCERNVSTNHSGLYQNYSICMYT